MNVKVLGIFVLLVVLCLIMVVVTPQTFLLPFNIENLIRRTALYGILGIGVAFVIITGGIDLSIGSIVCLTGVLLALFLQVDYQPLDSRPVLAVEGSRARIVVPADGPPLERDALLRYYGGRRAQSAVVKVVEVKEEEFTPGEGPPRSALALTVDRPLSADDRHGQLARVYAVRAFERGDAAAGQLPQVTLAGDHPRLRPRDQIALVHPESGLKQTAIAAVEPAGGDTRITLATDVGPIDTAWLAQPLLRRQRMPVPLAVALVLGIALLLGLLHGLLVTKLGLQPFVVTLCGLLFYRGISRWIVDDQTMGFGNEYDHSLSPLATGKLPITEQFGIPIPFFILIATAIAAAVLLNKTIWGRYMLALGRNEEAARYSGINTDRMTTLAYVLCTALAGVGGILFALDANSVAPSSHGNFFELYAIAAAVLGGCSLRGGEGSILGVLIGTAVMRVLYNMITLLKISTTLEFAIIGLVILAGVIADELIRRVAARRRAGRQTE